MILLTKIRMEKGLSKAKLARLAEIDQASISRIEAGRMIPYPKQLKRIANALHFKKEESEILLQKVEIEDLKEICSKYL